MVKAEGGFVIKLLSIVGLPDRLFLFPGARVWFVEFKAPGGRVSPRQRHVFWLLGQMGFPVAVIDNRVDFKKGLDMKIQATVR